MRSENIQRKTHNFQGEEFFYGNIMIYKKTDTYPP